jgi:hypothetical protein
LSDSSPPDIDRSLNEAPTDKLPFVIIYYSVIKSINVLPPLSGASDREKVYDWIMGLVHVVFLENIMMLQVPVEEKTRSIPPPDAG